LVVGAEISDAKVGIEMVSAQLRRETIDGRFYWMPQGMSALPKASNTVYLLPGFDEYMLGYTDRSASLDPLHTKKILPGNNGAFSATIVIGGRVVGTWKRVFQKQSFQREELTGCPSDLGASLIPIRNRMKSKAVWEHSEKMS
jgi:Winged helix DNA-binding domain